MKPGKIHCPFASMTVARAGGFRPAPTSLIFPCSITTVPLSIGGPAMVKRRAPVKAYDPDSFAGSAGGTRADGSGADGPFGRGGGAGRSAGVGIDPRS